MNNNNDEKDFRAFKNIFDYYWFLRKTAAPSTKMSVHVAAEPAFGAELCTRWRPPGFGVVGFTILLQVGKLEFHVSPFSHPRYWDP